MLVSVWFGLKIQSTQKLGSLTVKQVGLKCNIVYTSDLPLNLSMVDPNREREREREHHRHLNSSSSPLPSVAMPITANQGQIRSPLPLSLSILLSHSSSHTNLTSLFLYLSVLPYQSDLIGLIAMDFFFFFFFVNIFVFGFWRIDGQGDLWVSMMVGWGECQR